MSLTVATGALLIAGGVGAAAGVWSFFIEPRLLTERNVRLRSERWPRSWTSLRIAVLGDIHVGAPGLGLARLDRIVARINAMEPDLVLLLGDYVIRGRITYRSVLFGRFVEPAAIAGGLGRLTARHGVYSVLGNHDWYHDGAQIRGELERAGIVVLENESAAVGLPDGRLWLAGLADCSTRTPDIGAALSAVPEDEPVIVMSHDPAIFPAIPGHALVTLCGHTHGGQVRMPLLGAMYTPGPSPLRHSHGHICEDGKDLYVTAGLGTSILPMRFNIRPEFTILTITAADG